MNDGLYNEVYDEAASLFRTYNNKVKGQMVTSADNFEYWITYVAYQRGYNKGYSEGYGDGTNDILKSGREI